MDEMSDKIVIGCNYHTTWQKHKAMRFVLVDVQGTKARLKTRTTNKIFWTDVKDLIFIETKHNRAKAMGFTEELKGGGACAGKVDLQYSEAVNLWNNG